MVDAEDGERLVRTRDILEGALFEPDAGMAFAPQGLMLSYKQDVATGRLKPGTATLNLVLPSPTGKAWVASQDGSSPPLFWTGEEQQKLEAVTRAYFDIRRPEDPPLQGNKLRTWLDECVNHIVIPFDARRSGSGNQDCPWSITMSVETKDQIIGAMDKLVEYGVIRQEHKDAALQKMQSAIDRDFVSAHRRQKASRSAWFGVF